MPDYVFARISKMLRKLKGSGTIKEVTKSRSAGLTRIFIEESPLGWWIALKLINMGTGKLYVVREVGYLDVPSVVMELAMKPAWKPEYAEVIEKELKAWGLKQ